MYMGLVRSRSDVCSGQRGIVGPVSCLRELASWSLGVRNQEPPELLP